MIYNTFCYVLFLKLATTHVPMNLGALSCRSSKSNLGGMAMWLRNVINVPLVHRLIRRTAKEMFHKQVKKKVDGSR